MTLLDIVTHVQNFGPLLGIFLAFRLKREELKKLRYGLLFLTVSLLINVLVYQLNVYFILGRAISEYFYLTILLSMAWMMYKESNEKKALLVWGLVTASIYMTSQVLYTSPYSSQRIITAIGPLSFVVLSFRYFYYFYQTEFNISKNPTFIMVAITLFYGAGSFFSALTIEYINRNNGEFAYLWMIQGTVAISSYLAFACVIWLYHRKNQQKVSFLN